MKISVISDDLTGASDCGGQLVRYGLDVSVVLTDDNSNLSKKKLLYLIRIAALFQGKRLTKELKTFVKEFKVKHLMLFTKKLTLQ